MYPLFFFGFAAISSLINIWRLTDRNSANIIQTTLKWLMVWCIGAQGIFAGFFQIVMPEQIAKDIGWEVSPFMFEVASYNLALGISALMVLFWKGYYYLGPIITYGIFMYGAFYGHLKEQAKGDTSAYNTGLFLWFGDFIVPTLILIMGLLYYFKVLQSSQSK